jgi:hypothetical protein
MRTTPAHLVTTALLASSIASAQTFDLSWYSLDSGGATFSAAGGGWELGGTIAQPDAGGPLTGGPGFELVGGFWFGVSSACPGDVDGDRQVSLSDLSILLSHFGTANGATLSDGDVDGDNDVDLSDLSILLSRFGATCF